MRRLQGGVYLASLPAVRADYGTAAAAALLPPGGATCPLSWRYFESLASNRGSRRTVLALASATRAYAWLWPSSRTSTSVQEESPIGSPGSTLTVRFVHWPFHSKTSNSAVRFFGRARTIQNSTRCGTRISVVQSLSGLVSANF